jgi:signal transduction histidine kinase
VLYEALRVALETKPFENAAQCKGKKYNGEIFLADTWFSTYKTPRGMRLAAIIVDSSEELRDREERHLLQVSMTNRVTIAAISHEIRNFCGAISLLYSNMKHSQEFQHSRRFRELGSLVEGLEKIAVMELESTIPEMLEEVPLTQVLEDLRIIVEPAWTEAGGAIRWLFSPDIPTILCHRHGLLQAFLNVAQNSLRAVQGRHRPGLTIEVTETAERVTVRFKDTGPGVPEPQHLFKPFRPGAGSAGMGLYVSRAILRHFGGDLRYEPTEHGACFAIDLEIAEISRQHPSISRER